MKINTKKIKNIFKKTPKVLALHPFLAFWALLALAIILGGLIFYKYSVLVEKPETGISREVLRFGQETYQDVITQWQERERNLEEVESKQYISPFRLTREVELPPPEGGTSTPEEQPPEETNPPEIEKLLGARSLFEFYWLKGERLPSIYQREIMWNERKLGSEYKGTKYQNILLLEELKKELTG
jgi:hypothetical protein